MDAGRGSFLPVSDEVAKLDRRYIPIELSRVFEVGEVLTIRSSRFRVERIKTRGLRLLLLPDEETVKENDK